ncbi:hypothetical protein Tco_0784475 [Tanacetum coccineum]
MIPITRFIRSSHPLAVTHRPPLHHHSAAAASFITPPTPPLLPLHPRHITILIYRQHHHRRRDQPHRCHHHRTATHKGALGLMSPKKGTFGCDKGTEGAFWFKQHHIRVRWFDYRTINAEGALDLAPAEVAVGFVKMQQDFPNGAFGLQAKNVIGCVGLAVHQKGGLGEAETTLGIDPHHFNVESDLIESLLNRDTLNISSPKFDSLLEEFSGELAHIDLIPPGINEWRL